MARPRIFVSSTYYDLKYIRASLDLFIGSLGFESVLSEKGDIAYTSDRPLDESCYREAENAEIFVLIVGGRYGAEVSAGSKAPGKTFFERYESITKKEYEAAVIKEIPIYVLIEKGVYSEYQTFSRNKELKNISYAHVDSVNVFYLIEDILSKPRNNPIHTFEKFEEIELWLREQWAGTFRELLRRQSQQQQLSGLSQQVVQLKETNETLKKYLEAIMRGVGGQETSRLIESEEKRLDEVRKLESLRKNPWFSYVRNTTGITDDVIMSTLSSATGFEDFSYRIKSLANRGSDDIEGTLRDFPDARRDLNIARKIIGLPRFKTPEQWVVGEVALEPDELLDIIPQVATRAGRRESSGTSSGSANVRDIKPVIRTSERKAGDKEIARKKAPSKKSASKKK